VSQVLLGKERSALLGLFKGNVDLIFLGLWLGAGNGLVISQEEPCVCVNPDPL